MSKLFRNVTCFNSLEMSHSFFSCFRHKPVVEAVGTVENSSRLFLRRVFQAPVGKWGNMQFVFPLFHRRGSFHSFPPLSDGHLSRNHFVASCFLSAPRSSWALVGPRQG